MRARLKVSRAGVDLIKSFEGLRTVAARLPDGRWTLGYGHTFSAREGATCTQEDADALLRFDLLPIADAINNLVLVPINQNQFDALVSFCFNIGIDNFAQSTVLKRINEGRMTEAALAMDAWRSAEFNGQTYVLAPLIRRRAAEKNLFLTPDEVSGTAPSLLVRPVEDAGQPTPPAEVEAPDRNGILSARPAGVQSAPTTAFDSAPNFEISAAPQPGQPHDRQVIDLAAYTPRPAEVSPAHPGEPTMTTPSAGLMRETPVETPLTAYEYDTRPAMSPEIQAAIARAQEEERLAELRRQEQQVLEQRMREEAMRQAEMLAAARAAEEARQREEAARREEARRIEFERLEAARLEQARQEDERLAHEREERERALRDEMVRAELARLEQARAEQVRLEAERLDRERELARLEAERLDRERTEAARLEAERLQHERTERERQELARQEAERLDRERTEAARREAERLQDERTERERQEQARQEAERLEREREAARLEAERLEREREAARLEAERLEREREAARVEAERLEREREAARLEAERIETARLEAERQEEARQQAARAEAERLEAERREAERQERDRADRERQERERAGQAQVQTATTDDAASVSPEDAEKARKAEAAAALMRLYSPYGGGGLGRPLTPKPAQTPPQPSPQPQAFAPAQPAPQQPAPQPEPPQHLSTVASEPETEEVQVSEKVSFAFKPAASASSMPAPQVTALNPYARPAPKAEDTVVEVPRPAAVDLSAPSAQAASPQAGPAPQPENLNWREQLQRPLPADYQSQPSPSQAAQSAQDTPFDNTFDSEDDWINSDGRVALSAEEGDEETASLWRMLQSTFWVFIVSVLGVGLVGIAAGSYWKATQDAVVIRGGQVELWTWISLGAAAAGITLICVSVWLMMKRLGGLKD